MITNWFVMSKKEAKEYCNTPHTNQAVIISINNSFESEVKLIRNKTNQVKDILSLSFDDVLKSELTRDAKYPHIWVDRYGNALSPIDESDCKKIYFFITKYNKTKDDYTLIVHCEKGVSRSAAVMAAILKYLFNDDMPIYKNDKYRPNPDIYRAVYNELMTHKTEDEMTVNKNNLRFSIQKSPFGYTPIFNPIVEKHNIAFVPSVEACEIMPELKNVKEYFGFKGTGIPFYQFNFATLYKSVIDDTVIFEGNFSIDENMYEHREDVTSCKDSFSYMLMQLHQGRQFPDVSVVNETKMIDGKEYEVTCYYIILYNVNSPYFYQSSNDYEDSDWEDSLIELEYTFPENYKTWAYIPVSKIDTIFATQENRDIGCKALDLIWNTADYEPCFISNQYNNDSLVFDAQIFKEENTQESNFVIGCIDSQGKVFNLIFSQIEWRDTYLPNYITNFRVVKF